MKSLKINFSLTPAPFYSSSSKCLTLAQFCSHFPDLLILTKVTHLNDMFPCVSHFLKAAKTDPHLFYSIFLQTEVMEVG